MNKEEILSRFNREKYIKLVIAIMLDGLGMMSYLIPGIGESMDLAWAPIAAFANFLLFRGMTGATGGAFTLFEEMMPGADVIPSVTMTWAMKYWIRGENTLEMFLQKQLRKEAILNKYLD